MVPKEVNREAILALIEGEGGVTDYQVWVKLVHLLSVTQAGDSLHRRIPARLIKAEPEVPPSPEPEETPDWSYSKSAYRERVIARADEQTKLLREILNELLQHRLGKGL